MWNLLKLIFIGNPPKPKCNHKWKIIKEGELHLSGRARGLLYVLQCEHCGDVKSKSTLD